jgi:hypothetical protein
MRWLNNEFYERMKSKILVTKDICDAALANTEWWASPWDGGSKLQQNVSQYVPEYMVQHYW